MAELKIIFEMDTEVYQALDSAQVLKEKQFDTYTRIEEVISRYFNPRTSSILSTLGCFVSPNYQVDYGNFRDYSNPRPRNERFGPALVFGMGLNTGERPFMESRLREALREIERIVPEARKKLRYEGILHCSSSLVFKDEEKGLVNSLLKEPE